MNPMNEGENLARKRLTEHLLHWSKIMVYYRIFGSLVQDEKASFFIFSSLPNIINQMQDQIDPQNQPQESNNQPKPTEKKSRQEALAFVWETLKVIVISLAIIVPIRYFLVQPFFVKGASMEPTFEDGNYILIDEISYRFNEPKRGDIVVFRFPQDKSQFFIKRIIGMPGETVKIENSTITISNNENPDGFVLNESSYLPKSEITTGTYNVKLDSNEYFVLGDNRMHSSDSRYWGPVNRSLVTGRVFFRAFPPQNIGGFPKVSY